MTAIREPGKINENITLIDFGYADVARVGGVYLVESEKKCLIDSGTINGASIIIKKLKEMDAFPPDYVVLTHSHWDHSQGVTVLREKAQREQKSIEVMASQKAIPLLEDQSFNTVFHPKQKYKNITDVIPLTEGEIIDLDGLTLKIFDVPGHIKDHIAILDEKNKSIFVGDAIGNKVSDNAFLSAIMPPYCSKTEFDSTIEKLKRIDYTNLGLAHFGYIHGEEAKSILDEGKMICDKTWEIFEIADKENKLDDIEYIVQMVQKEFQPIVPNFKVEKFIMRFMLGTINGVRKLARKKPISTGDMLLKEVLGWQSKGYKMAQESKL
ncbi:MAG: MBL fold metallo-hydrolase [Candidatus Hodarchaeales archaeon]|jgi:glyoxylase-like metal-dependent hydrolase (beta-lactamase superfamily II)